MTTTTPTRTRTKTVKVLGDVYLDVYIGEQDLFVKVSSPEDIELEPQERQAHIRRFYRWAAANFGLEPNTVWDPRLRWAKLPLRSFGHLSRDFAVRGVSEKDFYIQEG